MTNINITTWEKDGEPPNVVVIPFGTLMDVWADGFVSGSTSAQVSQGMSEERAVRNSQLLIKQMNDDPGMRAEIIELVRERVVRENLNALPRQVHWQTCSGNPCICLDRKRKERQP